MNSVTLLNNEITAELKGIVENITDSIAVKKIILFGSYAYGNPRNNSNIDLCVITDDKRRKIEIIWDIQEVAYKSAKHSLDILVYRPDEFSDRSDSVSTIEKTISNKGILIYG